MVQILDDNELTSKAIARKMVGSLLPSDVIEGTERVNADVDWRRLLRCLDSVFLVDGGGLAQWAFLNRPLDDLQGQTPAEALVAPNGHVAVMRATRQYAVERARTRRGRWAVGVTSSE